MTWGKSTYYFEINDWSKKWWKITHCTGWPTNLNKYFFAKASPFQVRFFWVALYGNMPLFYNSVCGQCFSIGNTKKRSLISRDISLHGLHACFFMETLHTYGSLTRKLSLICIHRRKLSSLFQSWMGVVVITWTKFHCVIEWPMINELKRLGRNLRGKYFFASLLTLLIFTALALALCCLEMKWKICMWSRCLCCCAEMIKFNYWAVIRGELQTQREREPKMA